MKKHWTQKLKEENQKLRSDIKKIVNGDQNTALIYKLTFKIEDDLEKAIWMGDSTLSWVGDSTLSTK